MSSNFPFLLRSCDCCFIFQGLGSLSLHPAGRFSGEGFFLSFLLLLSFFTLEIDSSSPSTARPARQQADPATCADVERAEERIKERIRKYQSKMIELCNGSTERLVELMAPKP